MTQSKGIASTFSYFYTSSRFIFWVATVGAVLFVIFSPVMLLSGLGGNELFALFMFSIILCVYIPYMAAVPAFRLLIASHHFGLVPYFHYTTGISLLAFTLIISVLPAMGGAVFLDNMETHPGKMAFWVFVSASLYAGIVQYFMSVRANPNLLVVFALAIFFTLHQYGTPVISFANSAMGITLVVLLCVLGWGYALHQLKHRRVFLINEHTLIALKGGSDPWAMNGSGWWGENFRGTAATAAGTILLGYPDSLGTRVLRLLGLVVLLPLLNLLFLYLLNFFDDQGDAIRAFTLYYLMLMVMITSFSQIQNGELANRARYLWLHQGQDRLSLWHFLEQTVLTNILLLSMVVAIPGLAIFLLTELPAIHMLNGFTIIIMALLFTYFGFWCQAQGWRSFFFIGSAVLGISLMGVSAAGIFNELYRPVIIFQIVCASLVILCRHKARASFLEIDWIKIRPARTRRIITAGVK